MRFHPNIAFMSVLIKRPCPTVPQRDALARWQYQRLPRIMHASSWLPQVTLRKQHPKQNNHQYKPAKTYIQQMSHMVPASGNPIPTVAQTRHFIKHLLQDFTKHLLHDFTISSTILQFPPRFYNFLHDFTISSTILQFSPRFYNFLHDITISSTILQFPPRFYNFLHDFTIFSTILQFPPRFYNFLHDFTISSTILQFSPRFYNFHHDFTISSTILQFPPRFYNFLHDFTISSTILQFPPEKRMTKINTSTAKTLNGLSVFWAWSSPTEKRRLPTCPI